MLLPGIVLTHQVLDDLAVAHSGSGLNIKEASEPAIISRGGYKLAFLSYADHYDDWAAGKDKPGINYINPARCVFCGTALASTPGTQTRSAARTCTLGA